MFGDKNRYGKEREVNLTCIFELVAEIVQEEDRG
jgi:hypothetical protein